MADTTLVSLAALVEDYTLYPRNRVDTTHITDLVRAMTTGATLPPIVAERQTLRIVDGVHRLRAARKVLGDTASVPVILKSYADEAELFLDAVALNAQHGRKLDRHDQTRIVLRLHELKVPDTVIASALHVPEPDVTTLSMRVVYDESGDAVPSKRGLEHMRGERLTPVQISTVKGVRSAEAGRLALELTKLLDHQLVDLADEQIMDRLEVLARSIAKVLKKRGRAKQPA